MTGHPPAILAVSDAVMLGAITSLFGFLGTVCAGILAYQTVKLNKKADLAAVEVAAVKVQAGRAAVEVAEVKVQAIAAAVQVDHVRRDLAINGAVTDKKLDSMARVGLDTRTLCNGNKSITLLYILKQAKRLAAMDPTDANNLDVVEAQNNFDIHEAQQAILDLAEARAEVLGKGDADAAQRADAADQTPID